jgi:hypothetical protein
MTLGTAIPAIADVGLNLVKKDELGHGENYIMRNFMIILLVMLW